MTIHAVHRFPQHSINTVTTNVPGPQFPLYCIGREMLAYHPFVPISDGVRVSTGILSYNGRIFFGITGDFETAPDVEVLASGASAGIEQLCARARCAERQPDGTRSEPARPDKPVTNRQRVATS